MKLSEKAIKKNRVYKGKIFTINHDEVLLPDGKLSFRDIVHHHGGVCCAAMNEKGELAFVRQYRYAYGKTVLELPAGKLERGENPLEAMKRELMEEVGAQGENWRDMGFIYPSPGYTDEIIHLFSCNISQKGEQKLDDTEFLQLSWIPLEKAREMARNGEIPDAKSAVLLLKI